METELHAFLAETPVPEGPEFLKFIQGARITAGGKSLSWKKGEETYRVDLPAPRPPIVDGFCDLGIMTRKDETFRLLYTARVQYAASQEPESEASDHLRVRLVAAEDEAPAVVVSFRGKPVAGAVVKAFPDDGEPTERKTDEHGIVAVEGVAEGKVGLLAKWAEPEEGEKDGKTYREVRYYATFTVAPASEPIQASVTGTGTSDAASTPKSPHAPFALLPEAVNSFGGAVAGDWLYVYSGHTGQTHHYHESTTTPHFRRLDLKDRKTWEELPMGPALQGMPLVSYQGQLYRTGGMAAHNKAGTPNDLVSVADFAKFDPETKTWTNLPPLPSSRSTHDAVVVGDRLYVVGGWSMNGGDAINSEFLEDALVFDLSKEDGSWETLPAPPFQRRALAAASIQGKLYVLGGLTEEGKVVKTVDIYDPATQAWSSGPDLPGDKLEGFAASAFGIGDRLYVSGHDGRLYRLAEAGTGWDVVGSFAVPRLTHRLLPGLDSDVIAVGGNFAGVPTRIVESIRIGGEPPAPEPRVVAVPVVLPSDVKIRRGAAVNLLGANVMAVGGSQSPDPHGFQPKNLSTQGVSISLGSLNAESIPPLPEPRQSDVFLVAKSGRKSQGYLIGGIGPDGQISRTLGDVFQYDPDSRKWSRSTATIPDDRGMFGAAELKRSVWLFGGSTWDPRPDQTARRFTDQVLRWEWHSPGSSFEATPYKIPRSRRSFAGAVIGSKYYLIGGLGEDQELVNPVDVFDMESGEWTSASPPAKARLFADTAVLGGKIYLAGGFVRGEQTHLEPARSVEVFDSVTGTWSTAMEEAPVPGGHVRVLPVQNRLVFVSFDPEKTGYAQLAIVAP
jgi:N-acetylneuraminic acid mutarotase